MKKILTEIRTRGEAGGEQKEEVSINFARPRLSPSARADDWVKAAATNSVRKLSTINFGAL